MMVTREIERIESVGELKAYCRERHICPRCCHVHVCHVAAALDPMLLIVISHCLAFKSEDKISCPGKGMRDV